MIVELSRAYTARDGSPTVQRFDSRIFELTYFHHCMDCTFCHDSCCQFGATIESPKVAAILERADELEPRVGSDRGTWFDSSQWRDDWDYPGGKYTRTRVERRGEENRCIFLNRDRRGCLLHTFAVERGIPVHDLKPMACNLFPVLWDEGSLIVPDELDDGTLICRDTGFTLYRSARNDLRHYFGNELVAELDDWERRLASSSRAVSLPMASAS